MRVHTRWAAAVVFAALALGAGPRSFRMDVPAQAQNPGQRVVEGVVENEDGAEVAGATVFLRNPKTKSIRSYTSVKDGKFRFAQVNMNEDFDLWAEKDGKKSAVKTVSAWDTRTDFHTELKIK
jgi:hypothetical protein